MKSAKYASTISEFLSAAPECRKTVAEAAEFRCDTTHPRVNGGGNASGLLVDRLIARNGVVLAQSPARVTPGYTYSSDGVMLRQVTPD